MIKHHTIQVSFEIYDFNDDPAHLTEVIGLKPSGVSRKGQLVKIGSKDKKVEVMASQNVWRLDSTLGPAVALEQHIDGLLKILAPHANKISQELADYRIKFRCTLLYEDSRPGITLTKNQLQQIADLGADLDLDFYFLGGAEQV